MKKAILNVPLSTGTPQALMRQLMDWAKAGKPSYCCVVNVHMVVEANKDKDFLKVVQEADMATADGVPLLWALRTFHKHKQPRVAGMDMLPELLKMAEAEKVPVYFYGGTDNMLEKTKLHLAENYPSLQVAGMYSPPFRALSDVEKEGIIRRINDSGARMVFVVLGCPKQEKWMASVQGKVNAVSIGIGGALPVIIGDQKRAPGWMQKTGTEWFYRFIQEPRRLFKRYAVTNTTFIFLFIKAWFRQLFRKEKEDQSIARTG